MEKMPNIIVDEGQPYARTLSRMEGVVSFSCRYQDTTPRALTVMLADLDKEFLIKGQPRLNVGERVVFHYDDRCHPYVVNAYEILRDGEVVYRDFC